MVGLVAGLTDMMSRSFEGKFIPMHANEQTSDVDVPWWFVRPRRFLNAAT
jgi:hypothetical protein